MNDPMDPADGCPADDPEAVGVSGRADIGSQALARALATRDLDAIGRALRHDVAVVPVVTGDDGRTVNRVFPVAGRVRGECAVFSSTAALAMFLEDDDIRRFVLAPGDALRDFLLARHEWLTSVVFDPAGPCAVEASVGDVIAALAPRPDDDDVAWAIRGGEPGTGEDAVGDLTPAGVPAAGTDEDVPGGAPGGVPGGAPGSSSVAALTIALHHDWAEVGLDDPAARDRQIDELATRRLPRGDGEALAGEVFEEWMYTTCRRAIDGGRFLALLLRRTRRYPVAFGLTMYWFELGAAFDVGHLQRITDLLRATLGAGDELSAAAAPAGRFVRHAWVVRTAGRAPLALVDYWFAFPDGSGLCLLAFSTPQERLRAALRDAADRVALSAAWVRRRRTGRAR